MVPYNHLIFVNLAGTRIGMHMMSPINGFIYLLVIREQINK